MNRKSFANFVLLTPLIFGFVFGWLILRAKYALGVLPSVSMATREYLLERAPLDANSSFFSYGAHLNLSYLLLPFVVLSVFFVPLSAKFGRFKIQFTISRFYFFLGLSLTCFLLAFQQGQLLLWFLK